MAVLLALLLAACSSGSGPEGDEARAPVMSSTSTSTTAVDPAPVLVAREGEIRAGDPITLDVSGAAERRFGGSAWVTLSPEGSTTANEGWHLNAGGEGRYATLEESAGWEDTFEAATTPLRVRIPPEAAPGRYLVRWEGGEIDDESGRRRGSSVIEGRIDVLPRSDAPGG